MLRAWSGIWRLLAVVVPLSILAIAACAVWLLALSPAYATLVAGIIAPTDPVLAEEVKAGPSGSQDDSDACFNLTGEAGLNDGLAFPVVLLALAMADLPDFAVVDFGRWLVRDLLWAPTAEAASGALLGAAPVWVNRALPPERRSFATKSGAVALALSFLSYGASEWVAGNGFVAVFFLAVTIRNAVREVDYPRQLDRLLSEMEQLVMVAVVALFGLSIGNGLLDAFGPREVVFVIVVLLVVRPLATWIGLIGCRLRLRTRIALSYFGIRGLGALFYLTYALERGAEDMPAPMVGAVALVVLVSIVLYGASTGLVVRHLRLSEASTSQAR